MASLQLLSLLLTTTSSGLPETGLPGLVRQCKHDSTNVHPPHNNMQRALNNNDDDSKPFTRRRSSTLNHNMCASVEGACVCRADDQQHNTLWTWRMSVLACGCALW